MSKSHRNCAGLARPSLSSPWLALGLAALSGTASLAAVSVPDSAPAAGHKIEVRDPSAGKQILARGGSRIADYGGYQLYQSPLSFDQLGLADGELRDDYNLIRLNAALLDTSRPEIQALRQPIGEFEGNRMHLIQFAGPVQPSWRQALENAGVQIVTYVPENTYLVYGDSPAIARVQKMAGNTPHVQWDGPYLADYRIHPAARLVDSHGDARAIGIQQFAIQLLADPAANAGTLQLIGQLKAAPIDRQNPFDHYINVVVNLDAANLAAIAARPDVVSIQPYFTPRKGCERQDQIVAGNLTGSAATGGTVPSGPGYLAWLRGLGFNQSQFTNFVVDLSDSGIDDGTRQPNHPGLYESGNPTNLSRVAYARLEGHSNPGSTLKGCDGHGTLNAHIIMGFEDQILGFPHTDTEGYHYGLGVCPFARIGSSVIFDPYISTQPNFADLQSSAYNSGARVSNNSWGEPNLGGYNIDAQEFDALVRDAQPTNSTVPAAGNQEMVIVFCAGDSGSTPQTIWAPGSAKNVITVGAGNSVQAIGGVYSEDGCEVSDAEAASADDVFDFSSRGPCEDGRRKPDIMAPGTHVSGGVVQAANPGTNGTADACFNSAQFGFVEVCGGEMVDPNVPTNSVFFPDGQEFYTASDGTSYSAPAVSGGCALLRAYFTSNFGAPPSPAMTKAYLVNSARYMTGMDANDTLWSESQGMGEMDLGVAFDGTPRGLRDELSEDLFTASGQTRTYSGVISDTNKPLRITLAWTDAPGNTVGSAFNNNLDLTVTVGGVTYKGNVFFGAFSAPGGAADLKNNVESVFLPAGLQGTFTVVVTGANINSDGVPNNASPLDQDFALVVYNAVIGAAPATAGIQPPSAKVLTTSSVAFTVAATGTAPLFYQWSKDGTILPGATTATYSIASAAPNNAGIYSVLISNLFGTISPTAPLVVVPTVPLGYALNNTNLSWTTGSAAPWFGQTNVSFDGVASAESYFIGEGQQTSLNAKVAGPGTLTFWWKVSSQTNADFLSFAYGTNVANRISGEVNWQQQTVYLPSGTSSLQWLYVKDNSGSGGQDAGWVDEVTYVSGGVAPLVLTQPLGQNVLADTPVTFNVVAVGTPVLQYQWFFNGVNISGATNSAYRLASPTAANSGSYSVSISNTFGSTVSADATLSIVPVTGFGNNDFGQVAIPATSIGAMAIAGGDYHNLALRAGGSIVAWGNDVSGQCDIPTNLVQVVAVSAGGYHSLALQSDGTVVGWGANTYGQISPPASLSQVVAIAAGEVHSLALQANGQVVAWGDNSWGQTNVPALTNVIAIAAGGSHNLALQADGTVVGWGQNIGATGEFAGQANVPAGLANVIAIGAGQFHSLAVLGNGTVVAWGDNSLGQSQPPPNLTNAVAVTGGGQHSVALKANGTVVGWGNDYDGQLDFPATLTDVIAIAAGVNHSLVLIGDNTSRPSLLYPVWTTGHLNLWVQTFAGKHYALDFTDTLGSGAWTTVQTVYGNGAAQRLSGPVSDNPQRFYRVRQW